MTKRLDSARRASARHSSHHHAAARRKTLAPLWIGLAVLVLIGAAFLLFRPQSSVPSEVEVSLAHDMRAKGALFLDVRTQPEWDQGHIAGSILIPLDTLPTRLNELPRDQDIVVVCRSGTRSKEGTALLRQAGFDRVTCMRGGLQAWVAAGYPLTR